MVVSWEAIGLGTFLTFILGLGLLQLPAIRGGIPLIQTTGLALCGAGGLLTWNILLNLFSLANLDIDAPLIRVSIADLLSGVFALGFTLVYRRLASPFGRSFKIRAYLIPARAAFAIDLFFV